MEDGLGLLGALKPARFRQSPAATGWVCLAGICAAGTIPVDASAQQRMRPGEMISQPVVQPLPSRDNLKLNAALSRLGRNPRDLDALIDAGMAALAMGDEDAASGFFKRADQVAPRDPRVKAGLAGALVRGGDPLTAIGLFDEAEKAGAEVSALAADRGLAYDLVGDNASAQRFYRQALARGADEEVTRRLALSLAISGDRRGAEAALLPQLRDQNKAAWRTRTFSLAIMSQTDEAIRTAKTILPADLAESMTPYLRYMPQLTRAQQAAAANLGAFPRAAEIGREDPRFAQYAGASPGTPAVAAADAALVPRGEPLGRASRSRGERQAAARQAEDRQASRSSRSSRGSARVAPSAPQPSRQAVVEPATAATLATSGASSMSAPVTNSPTARVPQIAAIAAAPSASPRSSAAPAATPPATTRSAAPPPAAVPAPAQVAPSRAPAAPAQSGFDLAGLPRATSASPATAAVPTPAPAPARVSLAEAFRDLGAPVTVAAPAAGAVDISRITPARPKPEPEKASPPKPAPPSHPSRIWVQLGIGRDKRALATDWKKLARQAAEPFKGRKAFVSEMGQTNRMLTGPFDSAAQANKFIADLREGGVTGSYVWTSPAGQVVDALPGA